MRILFITSTYLGDAIISSGILEVLRLRYPKAKFTIACGPIPLPLFEAMPQVERLIAIEKLSYARHWLKLWFACILKPWSIIVDVRGTGLSHFLCAKKRYIWRSSNVQKLRVHQLAKLLKLSETPRSVIHVSPENEKEAEGIIKNKTPLICLSPASNWDKKSWPLENFVALGHQLIESFPGATLAVLGAPSQRQELQILFDGLPSDRTLDLIGKITLPTLAALLKKAHLFVGNDSGLMHLAASMGTPTLGLFGPSPETIYAPWGENANYIRTDMPFEDAMERARQGQNIMGTLTVERVMEKILTSFPF
jgi:ADP-heptose:LPS heptosyltransferase